MLSKHSHSWHSFHRGTRGGSQCRHDGLVLRTSPIEGTHVDCCTAQNEKHPAALQFVREFAKLGLTRSVGGVLGLALARELTPVITSIILAGQIKLKAPCCLSTSQSPRESSLYLKFLTISKLCILQLK